MCFKYFFQKLLFQMCSVVNSAVLTHASIVRVHCLSVRSYAFEHSSILLSCELLLQDGNGANIQN